MMDYLFHFTVGPVQNFIFQARKTQDLYGGSFLLSHLCSTALNHVSAEYGAQIIFPDKGHPFKPNVFVAVLPGQDDGKIKETGKELQDVVENELLRTGREILESLKVTLPGGFEEQLKSRLQVYWSAVPLGQGGYKEGYAKLQKAIGSVKNIRVFDQRVETGRKCSVSGEHNVLFYRGPRKAFVPPEAVSVPQKVPLKFMASGENLGAMAFVKRCLERSPRLKSYRQYFPSTAGIALTGVLCFLDQKDIKQYQELFKDSFDNELFYEENINKKYFEKYGYSVSLELAKRQLRKIYDQVHDKGLHMSKYYALVLLDGDNMGKWRSGELLPPGCDLRAFHKDLTGKLTGYAGAVQQVIPDTKGKLVYCGGDDVFAFVNLDYLLPVLKELRERFPQFLGSGKPSTASCGVVIAHYKTPLREVISWAKKMEKEAKDIDDRKDACSFAVLKRSGEIRVTKFKWCVGELWVTDIMLDLLGAVKRGDFSGTFLRTLIREFRYLTGEPMEHKDDIVKTEISRTLARSCMGCKKDEIDKLTDMIYAYYLESKTFENFLSFLEVIAFLEREVNIRAALKNN